MALMTLTIAPDGPFPLPPLPPSSITSTCSQVPDVWFTPPTPLAHLSAFES